MKKIAYTIGVIGCIILVITGMKISKEKEENKKLQEIENIYVSAITEMDNTFYNTAITKFNQVIEYKNAKDLIQECEILAKKKDLYEKAKGRLDKSDINKAIEYLQEAKGYEPADELLKKIEQEQNQYNDLIVSISNCGIDIKSKEFISYANNKIKNIDFESVKDKDILAIKGYIDLKKLLIEDSNIFPQKIITKLLEVDPSYTSEYEYIKNIYEEIYTICRKYDVSTTIWKSRYLGEPVKVDIKVEPISPTIGMTADEVRNSTWGYPTDINKTTYAWGIKEQWVYKSGSKRKYIYLEDGIVTAIQE